MLKRPSSIRVLTVIPLTILLFEHVVFFYYLSSSPKDLERDLIDFEDKSYDKRLYRSPPPWLQSLADNNHRCECSPDKVCIKNRILPEYNASKSKGVGFSREIPKIIHQTAKSRCLTKRFARTVENWRSWEDWSYVLHDDDDVLRLLTSDFAEFPHLAMIARECLLYGTLKADLWRYVVLWVYGGIYVDIDAAPAALNPQTLAIAQDSLFVVEQYHMLSQYFIAISPRHPLMWYAIQITLRNILQAPDTGNIIASMETGPHALHQAFRYFCFDAGILVDEAGIGKKPVRAGIYNGTWNRTVTAIGQAENQNEYVDRDVIGGLKRNEYRKMSMRHFQEDKNHPTGRSCLSAIYVAHESREGVLPNF